MKLEIIVMTVFIFMMVFSIIFYWFIERPLIIKKVKAIEENRKIANDYIKFVKVAFENLNIEDVINEDIYKH